MTDTLNTLMEQTAKGDHVAFRTLAHALGPRMFATAYRLMGNNRAAAEDAVQEALIKLWTSAPKWAPTGKIEAYASTIVRNCCMDMYRKVKPDYELDEQMADPTNTNTVNDIYAHEQHTMLMDKIRALPARQRDAIMMSYFDETSNKNIAAAMNISEKAAESLLVRARRTLARELPVELSQFNGKGEA